MQEFYDGHEGGGEMITLEEVQTLREQVLTRVDLLNAWQNALYQWDKNFKLRVAEKYGNTKVLQEVPLWQTLVGGSVESSPTLRPEQKHYVESEIAKFVRDFKTAYEL